MPAAPFIAAIAIGSGAATAIGAAIVGGVGLSVAGAGIAASLAASTVSAAVATAIGSGVISAGISIASGAKASDVLKSAVIGGVASYVGASVASSVTSSVANAAAGSSATSSIAASLGKVAGSMAGGGVSSAVGSVLSGKGDPIEALIKGGLTAGLTAGVMEGVRSTLSNVPGFDKYDTATGKTVKGDAPIAVQRAVTAGLAAGAMGKDADKAVLNSLLSTGTDYLSRGIKDLSSTLQTTYNNAKKTSDTFDRNLARQDEIVKDYNSSAEAIEAKRATLQADLDRYNENKDGYDNYDAKMQRDGYQMVGGDEYSPSSYAKLVGGRFEMRDDGEGGQHRVQVGGRWEPAPSRDSFLQEANKYATKVNDAIPGYEAERAKVETKLGTLSNELNTLKTELPTLEQTLIQQKTALDNTVTAFQTQEEENAQYIAKVFNDTVTAKTEVENALGEPVTQEQLDAFVKTGDVTKAAATYIDDNTTDRDEAADALARLGYTATDGEITQLTGRVADSTLGTRASDYVDPRQVTTDEARAAFQDTYGYTPTNDELAQFTGQRDEAGTLTDIGTYIDPRQVTADEARTAFRDTYGYTPTDAELSQFTGQRDETSTFTDIGTYVDPRQVTTDEAKTQFLDTYGYTPTDAELSQFTGQRDETSTFTDIGAYVDPRQVTADEFADFAADENFFFDSADTDFLSQYTGQRDEASTADAFRTYADPLATTGQEALDIYKQQYADIMGVDATDISDEAVLRFMSESGNTAEDMYTSGVQNQFSQDLGFDDYADRAYAQESLGAERPEADFWNQFKGTSGVVGVEDSDIAPVQFGATNQAATFIPQAEDNDFVPQDTYAASDYGPFLPDDPRSQETQLADNQFGFDQPFFDMATPSAPADFDVGVADATETPEFGMDTIGLGDVTSDIPGAQTATVEPPTFDEPALPDTQLSTAPTNLMDADQGIASAPVDTLAVSDMLDYDRGQGVQTASYQPPNIMSDTDAGDIGLRSLVTTQQGGTSGTADDLGIASLTDRNLTETTKPDLEALTKGSATYSALTDQDPTKTIGTSILDDESDDVRGGIQSGALYSGAENEFGASDTLTAKYLNEPKKEQDAEDVGLASSTTGTGNDTTTFAEPSATEQALRGYDEENDPSMDQFLSPLRTEKTTLPVSQEPARVTPTDLEKNMDEDFDWDAWDRATAEYEQQYNDQRNLADTGSGEVEQLLTPDGVDESFLDRLSPADRERYLAMQDPDYQNPLAELAPQDLGISQGNIDSFNQNFNPEGGFSSGWQTVGTDRIFINDDGTGIGMNENGESYALSPEEVNSMIKNGMLNTAASGYVAATGGTGNRPGGSGPTRTPTKPAGGAKSTGTDKLAKAITDRLMNPKALSVLGGAALGAASKPTGIDPRGLRSIATGTGGQRVQTGAKGTGGKGSVRYFEKKAAGGAIDGYAKGGGLGYLKSAHDGMEDKINATIDNKRPAKLSGGEFVIPADVVSHLGNGNSEAGAKQLYALMERVRKARTGTADQGKQINPKKYLPK